MKKENPSQSRKEQEFKCLQCGSTVSSRQKIKILDGDPVCTACLFEDHKPFPIYPIGFVRNSLQRGKSFSLKGSKRKTSQIHLFESQRDFLYKLEDEKRIVVVFYIHKQREIKSKFHRGLDGKKVGIFASRTPERLNPIAITEVRLKKVEGTTLFVKGLDAIDGTPVLDIKMAF